MASPAEHPRNTPAGDTLVTVRDTGGKNRVPTALGNLSYNAEARFMRQELNASSVQPDTSHGRGQYRHSGPPVPKIQSFVSPLSRLSAVLGKSHSFQ